jgi:voltage-gated potassium channel
MSRDHAPSITLAWRHRFFVHLDPAAWHAGGLSPINRFLTTAIVLSVVVAILDSEPLIHQRWGVWMALVEKCLGVVFIVEYLVRAWICVEAHAYRDGWRGRLRYLRSPTALIDLLALSPMLLTFIGTEAYIFRLFRMLRILRLARLGRFSSSLQLLTEAVTSRRYELGMSVMLTGFLLLVSSTVLYVVEGGTQPEAFGSIPRTMWWAIVTLTTVGYGDAYPVTVIGRICAGMTAVAGIGVIAMPTGILASAFSDTLQRHRHEHVHEDHH